MTFVHYDEVEVVRRYLSEVISECFIGFSVFASFELLIQAEINAVAGIDFAALYFRLDFLEWREVSDDGLVNQLVSISKV